MAKSVEAQLRAIAEKRMEDLQEIASASMIRLGNRIVLGTPEDLGTLANNWFSAYNKADLSTGRSGKHGGGDSLDNLREKAANMEIGVDFYFTNSLPYARRIEYEGHSAKAPKGMVRINTLHFESIVKQEIEKRK